MPKRMELCKLCGAPCAIRRSLSERSLPLDWVWVKIKPLGGRRFQSMFPSRASHSGYPLLTHSPLALQAGQRRQRGDLPRRRRQRMPGGGNSVSWLKVHMRCFGLFGPKCPTKKPCQLVN